MNIPVEYLILLWAMAACYGLSRHGELVFDDVILHHRKPVQQVRWRKLWRSEWRRLTWLSYGLNVWWFGPTDGAPAMYLKRALFGFHVVNVALHFLNALLLGGVARLLGYSEWGAFVVSLIYAVHPLPSSAVAYVSGRASVLAGTFSIAAVGILLYGYAIPAMLLLFLACLAKEDAIAVVGLVVVLGFLYAIPLWWLPAIPLVLTLVVKWRFFRKLLRKNGDSGMIQAGWLGSLPWGTYQATAFTGLMERLPFWVFGMRLSADPDVTVCRSWLRLAFSVAGLAGSLALVWPHPLAFTLWLWIFVSPPAIYLMVPVPDPVHEHRAYFAAAGMALGFGWVLADSPAHELGLIVAAFSLATVYRASTYRTWLGFWNAVLHDGGRRDRAWINLGCRWMEKALAGTKGAHVRARHYLQSALDVNPNLAIARANLAMLEKHLGRHDESIRQYQETVRRSPDHYQSWHALGCALEEAKRYADAADAYNHALAVAPWAPSLNRLGLLAVRRNQLSESEALFKRAMDIAPYINEYIWNYASILRVTGRPEKAVPFLKKLPKHIPLNADMLRVEERTA